jgi:hypothetical protein
VLSPLRFNSIKRASTGIVTNDAHFEKNNLHETRVFFILEGLIILEAPRKRGEAEMRRQSFI